MPRMTIWPHPCLLDRLLIFQAQNAGIISSWGRDCAGAGTVPKILSNLLRERSATEVPGNQVDHG